MGACIHFENKAEIRGSTHRKTGITVYCSQKLIWVISLPSPGPLLHMVDAYKCRGEIKTWMWQLSFTQPCSDSARPRKSYSRGMKRTIVFIYFLTSECFQNADCPKVHGLGPLNVHYELIWHKITNGFPRLLGNRNTFI